MTSKIKVDTIEEKTSGSGVTIGATGTTSSFGGISIAHENNSLFFTDSDVLDTTNTAAFDTGTGTSGTQGHGGILATADSNGYIAFAAEF